MSTDVHVPVSSEAAASRGTSRRLTVTMIQGSNAFRELERDWRQITEAAMDRNPFLTWEWVSEWANQFSGAALLVAVVRDQSQVVAIAPFHRRRYGVGPGFSATSLQLLSPLEVEHLVEIRDIATFPSWEEPALEALLNHLAAMHDWDWIRFAAQGRNLAAWERILDRRGGQSFVSFVENSPMPVMTLASTWTEQCAGLKRNIKESIRHSYNSLRRDGLEFEFGVDEAASPQVGWLDEFFRLHHQRAVAEGRLAHLDHFQRRAVRAGVESVLRRAAQAGLVRVFVLRIEGSAVAVRLGLEVNRSLYLYYSGFDPVWWPRGVMTLLMTEIVKWAIERRLETINLSPGVDVSKTRWGTEQIALKSYVLMNRSLNTALRWHLYRARKFATKRMTLLYTKRWLPPRGSRSWGGDQELPEG